MDVPTWVWIATGVVTLAIFTFDLAVVGRRPHEPSMKECATYLSIYVGMAVLFGLGVWYTSGGTPALEFYSGWLVEYSLSIDNLFIFIIIMAKFAVPRQYQQTALMIGIVLALIMRAIFIVVGAAAINNFSWVFYIFGLFLVWTAWRLAKEGAEHNVTANVVCPGFVRTPLVDKQIPEQAKELGISEDEVVKNVMLKDTVDGQFTTTDDVADAVLFFAGATTNAFTGQSLVVSHGWFMQ